MNKEVLDKLTLVSIGDYLPCDDCPKTDTLTVSINIDVSYLGNSELLDLLLNKHNLRNRNPQVYLSLRPPIGNRCGDYNLSTVISEHIKELHLSTGDDTTLMISDKVPRCPLFTCLNLDGFEIDPSVSAHSQKL